MKAGFRPDFRRLSPRIRWRRQQSSGARSAASSALPWIALPRGRAMSLEKIPATVITGFLGAGKTTLIRSLIAKPRGRRIALIINEFGDVGVDGEILKACGSETCGEDDVIELANGCICCTVADDFIPAMRKLIDR